MLTKPLLEFVKTGDASASLTFGRVTFTASANVANVIENILPATGAELVDLVRYKGSSVIKDLRGNGSPR